MIKVICDKCGQEITDATDVSTVVEDGQAKHYHKSGCFTDARATLTQTTDTTVQK
ncbi:hypothetical protein STSP2_01098 [Anaerohalosphaera lusitana]|uniref:Uncharacterized protein n=1 Tax=Anaerohalosphaera lusitana TaxID=1936003 RepID=A0A1U9NKA1_9BACT|nr:hypothetical protein [Anaerohalosphaera lusitana]AQT67946.1 hypothetical protein STSP2_01098 [Anaerohalosphaera lusitana]